MNRSALFAAYNAAKALAAAGQLDQARLNRALGIAQRKQEAERYVTTAYACSCPDNRIRHVLCKHSIALVLKEASK